MTILAPTFTYDNHLGTLKVYRKAFPETKKDCPSWFEQVRDSLSWTRNSMHSNHDRLIWDEKKVGSRPAIVNQIVEKIQKVMGFELVGKKSFANYYKNNGNRTFWHRDYDTNPDGIVAMVTFGATRTLTFTDYRTDKTYPVDLGDRDIVVFDFKWNLNTFHAVEKVVEATGERISIQFFSVRDESKWTKLQLQEWKETAPLIKQAVSRRRDKVEKLLNPSKKRKYEVQAIS